MPDTHARTEAPLDPQEAVGTQESPSSVELCAAHVGGLENDPRSGDGSKGVLLQDRVVTALSIEQQQRHRPQLRHLITKAEARHRHLPQVLQDHVSKAVSGQRPALLHRAFCTHTACVLGPVESGRVPLNMLTRE
eukprot:CAMPEP_0181227238 /NCGR_PEP_ID=MMETSP1096-20121128/32682_1 /TAXON_ID=156174 ORGANISM="Chrysochromulina ericina, Strain CCMP281" /NCGR_SAMPLE_ID=MMETSP1096 /ASSEMBLY_ACC=CAM_ASM_000453 /LENGTH=134 /DNA_ID=CAMNT_0023320631 /DNA_START=295 /DNA_END=699 /DNA_ORIENTATION=-